MVVGAREGTTGHALDTGVALRLLEQNEQASLGNLGSRPDVGTDVLHYLAQNGASATRQAVAVNPTTSAESNLLLADDADAEVRSALAKKIGQLFPGLLEAEQQHVRDITIETLEKLAQDEIAFVRTVLAEEIKKYDCVPKSVVLRLAHDAEPQVAMPVVEFSPLLNDRDLIEIIAACRASNVLGAVARRKKLSEDVSEAVAATLDISAVSELLANTSAAIRAKTLDTIISHAAEISEWHGVLVVRAELSKSAIQRLASFVADSYLDSLASRVGLDEHTRDYIRRRCEDRHKQTSKGGKTNATEERQAVDKANRAGTLNEAFVATAVEENKRNTIVCALSLLAKADEEIVRKVLELRSADAVTALVWRAGLGMRVAYKLQVQLMRLKSEEILYPRNGVDFPQSEEQMRQNLRFLGLSG